MAESGDESEELVRALRGLLRLARRLWEARLDRGALEMDLSEAEVKLDGDGFPVQIGRAERLDSHRIVEEFMLLANETAAAEASRRRIPFLYRTHPAPEPEKVEELAQKLLDLGVRVRPQTLTVGKRLTDLLGEVQDQRKRELASYLVLRAMERARYEARPSLHFGLASKCYCHFTSPIRRYPDLYNHRWIKASLFGRIPPQGPAEAAEVAEACTEAELSAEEAERESVRVKCMRYMQTRLGDVFEGMVTEVTQNGCFVELDELPVEGFVRRLRPARGRGDAGPYLGQRLRVRVVRADPYERELDLAMVKKEPWGAD